MAAVVPLTMVVVVRLREVGEAVLGRYRAEEAVRSPLRAPQRVGRNRRRGGHACAICECHGGSRGHSRVCPGADTLLMRPALSSDVHRRGAGGRTLAVVEELTGLCETADFHGAVARTHEALADSHTFDLVLARVFLDRERTLTLTLDARGCVLYTGLFLEGEELLTHDTPPPAGREHVSLSLPGFA